MKRVLITGAESYIGSAFERYVQERYADSCQTDTLDMRTPAWSCKSFVGYDAIFHVAGLAHQRETKRNAQQYYAVNRDLAIETAAKAKAEGVAQFVYVSSMSVYGMDTGVITSETVPMPKSHYGSSKLQAEEGLSRLADGDFKVCILRPPMVYGYGCRGHYRTLVKLAQILPFFPRVKNRRSMIYITNLCEFVRQAIEREAVGVFYPQNAQYVNTAEMLALIAASCNKRLHLTDRFEGLTNWGIAHVRYLRKACGSLCYAMEMSCTAEHYTVTDFPSSVRESVNGRSVAAEDDAKNA